MSRLPIRAGQRFDRISLEAARDSIARRLRNSGYPRAEVNNIFEVNDSLRLAYDTITCGDWTVYADRKRGGSRSFPSRGRASSRCRPASFARSSDWTRDACTAKTSFSMHSAHFIAPRHTSTSRSFPTRRSNPDDSIADITRASGGEYDEIRAAWRGVRNAGLLPRDGGDVELQFPSRRSASRSDDSPLEDRAWRPALRTRRTLPAGQTGPVQPQAELLLRRDTPAAAVSRESGSFPRSRCSASESPSTTHISARRRSVEWRRLSGGDGRRCRSRSHTHSISEEPRRSRHCSVRCSISAPWKIVRAYRKLSDSLC